VINYVCYGTSVAGLTVVRQRLMRCALLATPCRAPHLCKLARGGRRRPGTGSRRVLHTPARALAGAVQGAWLWRLKDRIDRAWMDGYGAGLPPMGMAAAGARGPGARGAARAAAEVAAALEPDARAALAADRMRCGGCGAKVRPAAGGAPACSLSRHPPTRYPPRERALFLGMGALSFTMPARPPPARRCRACRRAHVCVPARRLCSGLLAVRLVSLWRLEAPVSGRLLL